jgi:ribosomal protein S17
MNIKIKKTLPIRPKLSRLEGKIVKKIDAKTVKVKTIVLRYSPKFRRFNRSFKNYMCHTSEEVSESAQVDAICVIAQCRKISTLKSKTVVSVK